MGLRSTYARRKGTGRKPHHLLIRQHPVHVRRHRRFRGIHGSIAGTTERNRRRAMALVNKRRAAQLAKSGHPVHRKFKHGKQKKPKKRSAAALRRTALLRALNRKLHPRSKVKGKKRKVIHKRVVRKGLKRKFKGRKKATHKRVMPKGLHRKFKGRKKSTKPRVRKIGKKVTPPKGAPAISPTSYIKMF